MEASEPWAGNGGRLFIVEGLILLGQLELGHTPALPTAKVVSQSRYVLRVREPLLGEVGRAWGLCCRQLKVLVALLASLHFLVFAWFGLFL